MRIIIPTAYSNAKGDKDNIATITRGEIIFSHYKLRNNEQDFSKPYVTIQTTWSFLLFAIKITCGNKRIFKSAVFEKSIKHNISLAYLTKLKMLTSNFEDSKSVPLPYHCD
ncbi:Hypothetical predicted protein [Octopus vulgaris]|uniref:Uncharacterized protein n=1 Tax=Octopus vulgaris TaxID=6645 RepID=A0AA36F4W9_OCTVU|nr:Hypothetical predicted protein [Octopus vulgaris]